MKNSVSQSLLPKRVSHTWFVAPMSDTVGLQCFFRYWGILLCAKTLSLLEPESQANQGYKRWGEKNEKDC